MVAIELKYAPRECEYFCMGDYCLPNTNRSCGTDKDKCKYYKHKSTMLNFILYATATYEDALKTMELWALNF